MCKGQHTPECLAKISASRKGTRASIETEIKPGQRLSPATEFKRGHRSWNAGTKKFRSAICEACNKQFERPAANTSTFRFCSQKCAYSKRSGKQHPGWKGGKFVTKAGYVRVNIGKGKSQLEHILVAEKALGRPLTTGEQVHHINGVRHDNRNQNLLICDIAYHRSLERRMARLYQREHFPAAA